MASTWSIRQVRKLLSEMELYRSENNLREDEVTASIEGPAIISLADIGWDEREVYGMHTPESPQPKNIQV